MISRPLLSSSDTTGFRRRVLLTLQPELLCQIQGGNARGQDHRPGQGVGRLGVGINLLQDVASHFVVRRVLACNVNLRTCTKAWSKG